MKSGDTDGFTLTEALVGLLILSISLAALYRATADGYRSLAIAQQHGTAQMLAQSHLDAVTAVGDLTAGQQTGTFENGMSWILTGESLPDASDSQTTNTALWITLKVLSANGTQLIELKTAKLVPSVRR
jgi:prepilin-type N-terminal cleavage/methylation domain-containing protein